MARLAILFADSWGLLGNANAARGLQRRLRIIAPDVPVDLIAGEEVWPQFANWGRRIALLSALPDPDAVFGAYADLAAEVIETVGLWPEERPLQTAAHALALRLKRHDSQVIATKGLLARLALAARVGKVTNWITNPGLIDLRFHVCPGAHLTCVPRREDAARLTALGLAPERLRVTGPTIELPFSRPLYVERQPNCVTSPLIVLYAPTARPESMCALLRNLREIGDARVVLVTHANDRHDWEPAISDARNSSLELRICRGLSHAEFLSLLQQLRDAPDRVLISKSGPNSMFEVIELGLPLIVYRSGLPMEEWVISYVADHGIGAVSSDWSELAYSITMVIGNRAMQEKMIAAQAALRAILFVDRFGPEAALASAIQPEHP
ncbi:MAG: hypothetical protein INF92_04950 [Rhodobacter sp.]|nr:hypothetical protein [Rhodobacter sp.]